jgi:Neuraminidase (sialidase)
MKYSEFPVGAEVVVTAVTYGGQDVEVGKKGVVVKSDQDGRALVKFSDCSEWGYANTWYFDDDGIDGSIELVAKSKVAVEKKKKAPKGPQAYKGNGKHSWETVVENVQRLRVPGGWLYRDDRNMATVFVPVPQAVGYAV